MKIQDIIQQDILFQGHKNISHRPLNGGLSNETHIVTCNDTDYVVKIQFAQNEYLKVSRETELLAQMKAAELGIAPKVYSDTKETAYSISEFLEGHLITYDEVMEEENIVNLTKTLKKIHAIEGVDRRLSVFDLIEGYDRGIRKFKVVVPDGYDAIMKKVDLIREERAKDNHTKAVYCHNDFLNNNILYQERKIKVIDWELSGMGDPYMDLASLPYQMNYSQKQEEIMLKTYFGFYEEEMLTNLHRLKYVGMVREMLWALFFAGMNQKSANHDMDYYGAASYVYGRITQGFLTM